MELYFLRHAPALSKNEAGVSTDAERPLSVEGKKEMKRAARGMANLAVSPDRVISSPYLRARQTAEIAAEVLEFKKKIEFTEVLTPDADFRDFKKLLDRFEGDENILFVGHQPALGSFISELVSGARHILIDLTKGGLCRVDTSELGKGELAELEWLFTGEQLRRLS
ncbi:MAG: phosphohistidine phosphatase SixA [Candidatus Omnitrophota bacterium]